jgi:hypothetical protein
LKGGERAVTQVTDIRMANGEMIPDEWFENDMGPSPELAKMEPDGFTDRLLEKFRKAFEDLGLAEDQRLGKSPCP